MIRVFYGLMASLILLSCSKELSEENGIPSTNPPLGENCQVNEVTDVDSATGQGSLSTLVGFNTAGLATSAILYDSLSNTLYDETLISYRGDTMRVGPTEYFLLDGNKRVRSFVSLIGTGTGADTMDIRYSYDGAGYLSKRELFIDGAALPQYWYTYTWRNGDLVESEGYYRDISGPVRVLYAVMQYDQSINIKGYLIPIPDGFEVNRFLSAVNLGRIPQHLHTRTAITLFDPANQSQETFVNRLRSHVISADGYIQAYTSYTEATQFEPADSFRVRVGYFCK